MERTISNHQRRIPSPVISLSVPEMLRRLRPVGAACAHPEVPDLWPELRGLLGQIPPGSVTTYGDLAKALGSIRAARWVGEYMADHVHNPACMCHRVVRATGDIGLYVTGDPAEKVRCLSAEGVEVVDGRVDLQRYRFDAYQSGRPLMELTRFQENLSQQLEFRPMPAVPEFVAGVDVSYVPPDHAFATYTLVETQTGQLVSATTTNRQVRFPYVPGFLAYRELPALLELLVNVAESDGLADLILVDGNGILHPLRAGIAAHLGVVTGRPTIGVGKSLLCGSVDLADQQVGESRPVIHDGETIAMALRSANSLKPIYVSPGHLIDVDSALNAVTHLLQGHRLPEPLYLADRLSREVARQQRES